MRWISTLKIDKPPILDSKLDKKDKVLQQQWTYLFDYFRFISLSPGFDLSSLFEKDKSHGLDARFTTQNSASTVVLRVEEVAPMGSFKVRMTFVLKVKLLGRMHFITWLFFDVHMV